MQNFTTWFEIFKRGSEKKMSGGEGPSKEPWSFKVAYQKQPTQDTTLNIKAALEKASGLNLFVKLNDDTLVVATNRVKPGDEQKLKKLIDATQDMVKKGILATTPSNRVTLRVSTRWLKRPPSLFDTIALQAEVDTASINKLFPATARTIKSTVGSQDIFFKTFISTTLTDDQLAELDAGKTVTARHDGDKRLEGELFDTLARYSNKSGSLEFSFLPSEADAIQTIQALNYVQGLSKHAASRNTVRFKVGSRTLYFMRSKDRNAVLISKKPGGVKDTSQALASTKASDELVSRTKELLAKGDAVGALRYLNVNKYIIKDAEPKDQVKILRNIFMVIKGEDDESFIHGARNVINKITKSFVLPAATKRAVDDINAVADEKIKDV